MRTFCKAFVLALVFFAFNVIAGEKPTAELAKVECPKNKCERVLKEALKKAKQEAVKRGCWGSLIKTGRPDDKLDMTTRQDYGKTFLVVTSIFCKQE